VLLQEAATKLGLGITTLKRVCRSNGMTRWPFRKRNSLGRLIDRTKQVLDDGTGQDNMKKLMALQMLEKQRQVMRVWPLSLLWPLQALISCGTLLARLSGCHCAFNGGISKRCIQHCWIIILSGQYLLTFALFQLLSRVQFAFHQVCIADNTCITNKPQSQQMDQY